MKQRWVLAVLLASQFGMIAPAQADEASDEALRAEVQVLRDRLARIESQLAGGSSGMSGISSTADKAGLPTLNLPSGLAGLQMSGYADVSYIYNFARSDAGAARTNRGRVFDVQSNGFTPQAAELVFEKPVTTESPIGFRTDLFFGDDAELIHSTGAGIGTDQFDLQQAYVTARAPVGDGIDFKVGKFVTLLGAEVIESPANWNFSRSYLFGFAIPFTHTGALASYPLGSFGSVTAGVVNGWDIVDENNQFKSFLGNVTLTLMENLTLAVNGITGAERGSDNRNDRSVIDLVATWKPIDALTLMANYDYGHESNLAHGVAGTAGFDTANWTGVALYAKYDLSPTWALAGRWEWFDDKDNVRTALTGPGASTLGGIDFTEWTLTSQWQLYEHLLARLEYRHDMAGEQVFFHRGSEFTNRQDTVAAELIYHF